MAAAIRVRVGNITKNYVQTFLLQSQTLKIKQRICFHNSALLYVVGQEVKMPSLSPTMSEGTIVKWLKDEGDAIAAGDVLCDIQTDKAVVSFEMEEEGILAKILVREDVSNIKVGTVIALMVGEGEDWKNVQQVSSSSAMPELPSSPAAKPQPVAHSTVENFGPAVRMLLEQYHLNSSQVSATGRKGKLLKGDVLKYVAANKLKPKAPKHVPLPITLKTSPLKTEVRTATKPTPAWSEGPGYVDIQLSGMRRTIAKRLTESKMSIPHSYGVTDCMIDRLLALRKQLKEDGVKVSVNDFVIKAVALALQQYPQVNAIYQGEQPVYPVDIDVSVAVATDSGLITPIVKAADGKGLEEISVTVQSLAAKAREGKLQLHEFQGGTFTISNLGMFGVDEFSAIINPPQCAILAVGGSRLVLDEDKNPVTKMKITLCYDGRAFDEGIASEFLKVIREMLEEPTMMLLGGQRGKLAL